MPRIYTSANDPIDLCFRCFPEEDAAKEEYGHLGDGPDDRGNCFSWDAEHPPYETAGYYCCKCGKALHQGDDYYRYGPE